MKRQGVFNPCNARIDGSSRASQNRKLIFKLRNFVHLIYRAALVFLPIPSSVVSDCLESGGRAFVVPSGLWTSFPLYCRVSRVSRVSPVCLHPFPSPLRLSSLSFVLILCRAFSCLLSLAELFQVLC